jgi:hypothetical protein
LGGNDTILARGGSNLLGRTSDADGKAYWTGRLDAGLSRGELLIGFSESGKHRAATAALVGQGYFDTDDTYQAIALLYDNFTGWRPDASGLTYWSEQVKRAPAAWVRLLASSPGRRAT